jgi:hypothetical protein
MIIGPYVPSTFDQSTILRYPNRYEIQMRSGVINSTTGQIWRLVSGSLPPNSTLTSTGVITVNFNNNLLPFSPEQFIISSAPSIPSLSRAAWDRWLAEFVSRPQILDYEFQVEISDGTGPAQLGHTVRIVHLKPPVNVNFDMANYDRDLYDQTAGITSWFSVNQAYLNVDPAQEYYLVMTTSPDDFTWITPNNLGDVVNGSISRIDFQALTQSGRRSYYQVRPFSVSRVPQGVELLPDGYLSGRFSFRCYQDDPANLPVNDVYTFTVRTGVENFRSYSDRVFTLRVQRLNLKPYDSLWINAFPPRPQRLELYNILNDPNVIPDELIYRPSDPWWGRATFFRILMLPSMNLASQNDYELSMQTNHYFKRLLFDQLRMSVMLDQNLNSIYEVIYLTVRDEMLGRYYLDGNFRAQPDTIDLRPFIKNYHIDKGQTYYTLHPNALENMRRIVGNYIGIYNPGIAPEWMLSFQPIEDQPGVFAAPVGFYPVVVLAYCKPGMGRVVYHRLKDINFNNFEFESERFNLEARLSLNYNRTTNLFTPGSPAVFENDNTTFDHGTTRVVDGMEYAAEPTELDKYLIFPRFGVFR